METIFRHCVAQSEKHVSNLTVIYLVFITNIPPWWNKNTKECNIYCVLMITGKTWINAQFFFISIVSIRHWNICMYAHMASRQTSLYNFIFWTRYLETVAIVEFRKFWPMFSIIYIDCFIEKFLHWQNSFKNDLIYMMYFTLSLSMKWMQSDPNVSLDCL